MNANKTIRVVMFPWLAYGHITPYLELAKKLSTRNFMIYICSTPATLACIEKKINEKQSQFITLVPLLLPILPNLPIEFHTTNGLPHHLMRVLKQAFDSSAPNFADILAKIKPDLLIYDFLQPWAPLAAKDQNIPAVEFVTSSSTMTSFMFHYFKDPSIEFPFSEIYFRDYESGTKKMLLGCATNPIEKESTSLGITRSCNIVLIKGSRDIEDKYIDYVTSLSGKKFVAVGPLIQEPDPNDDQNYDIISWLDKKERKSTIFVSFGSECFLTNQDIHEVAYGLELISNINFIWVVRFPRDENDSNGNTLEETLPYGFLERVGNRGKVVEGWAPQAKILQHVNTGGFVSHCGWNSVLESMNFGVPIIAVPMHLDQPINARLVEEIGVGVEVLRESNKRLCRGTLAKVIKQVVIEDRGEFVRKNAADMKEKLRDNGDKETDEVVKELVKLCGKS